MTTHLKYASLALAIGLFGCSEQATSSADEPSEKNLEAVNIKNVRSHIKTLASDEFLGRGPLTEGETLTINYLADEY
ncbi:MAG: peptidase M28, partial [Pseudomonadota bacterium]|nr:peptidase M28 [Pseudomonadota bacterium]